VNDLLPRLPLAIVAGPLLIAILAFAYAAPTNSSGLQYGQEQLTFTGKSFTFTKSLSTVSIRTFTIRTLPICSVNIPPPLVTWSIDAPGTVQVTFSFTSSPPAVSDWGTLECGSDGICRVNVQVTGPAPPNCYVMWMTHKDSQTYKVPDDACGFEVWVNGNYATSVSFKSDCPGLQAPSGGGLWTDRSYYYLGETATVFLSYSKPGKCTEDIVTYDVIGMHDGSQVALLDTFGGSSTVGCWAPKEYKYAPTDDGLYTVQFIREDSEAPLLISEAEFQVGYGDSNESPVGGVISPVNTLTILAPYLALLGLTGVVMSVVAIRKKHRD
jgi:hypothetical protein